MPLQDIDPDRLRRLALDADRLSLDAKARLRLEWLLHYCEHGCSATATCTYFGIPRSALYRALRRFDPDDPASLGDRSRRPRRLRESRLPADVVRAILARRRCAPRQSVRLIAQAVGEEYGLAVPAASVRRVLARRDHYRGYHGGSSLSGDGRARFLRRAPRPDRGWAILGAIVALTLVQVAVGLALAREWQCG